MIQRQDTPHDLANFDWFNDAKDTLGWLRQVGRTEEAERMNECYEVYLQREWSVRPSGESS